MAASERERTRIHNRNHSLVSKPKQAFVLVLIRGVKSLSACCLVLSVRLACVKLNSLSAVGAQLISKSIAQENETVATVPRTCGSHTGLTVGSPAAPREHYDQHHLYDHRGTPPAALHSQQSAARGARLHRPLQLQQETEERGCTATLRQVLPEAHRVPRQCDSARPAQPVCGAGRDTGAAGHRGELKVNQRRSNH